MRKDFCLCFNDAYVPFACVTIQSIKDNRGTGELHIHVLSDSLSENSLALLKKFGVEVHIVNDDGIFRDIDTREWPIYTLYRLFLPNILGAEVHKVLYLDCDVIVNGNLDELFSINMEGKAVAGCLDTNAYSAEVFKRLGYSSSKKYICAGVLLMNLDYWRSADLSHRVIGYMKHNPNKIAYLEQDALNVLCQDTKIILPSRYGTLVPFFFFEPYMNDHLGELEELMDSPVIIHYAGYFPWIYCKNKSMHSCLWWNISKKTPIYSKVRRLYYVSMIKWMARYVLSVLHLVNKHSRYHIDQYYNHPRVKRDVVMKNINRLKKKLEKEKTLFEI